MQAVLGKKELAQRLHTADLKTAKRVLRPVIDEWHREFDRLSQRRAFTEEDLEKATWDHYAREPDRDRADRIAMSTDDEIANDRQALLEAARKSEIKLDTPLEQFGAALDIIVKRDFRDNDRARAPTVRAGALRAGPAIGSRDTSSNCREVGVGCRMGARQNCGARDQMVEVPMSYEGADEIILSASHPCMSLARLESMLESEE